LRRQPGEHAPTDGPEHGARKQTDDRGRIGGREEQAGFFPRRLAR